jgi:hypothetical protein
VIPLNNLLKGDKMKIVNNKLQIVVRNEKRTIDEQYLISAIEKKDYDVAYRRKRNAEQKRLIAVGRAAEAKK